MPAKVYKPLAKQASQCAKSQASLSGSVQTHSETGLPVRKVSGVAFGHGAPLQATNARARSPERFRPELGFCRTWASRFAHVRQGRSPLSHVCITGSKIFAPSWGFAESEPFFTHMCDGTASLLSHVCGNGGGRLPATSVFVLMAAGASPERHAPGPIVCRAGAVRAASDAHLRPWQGAVCQRRTSTSVAWASMCRVPDTNARLGMQIPYARGSIGL